MMSFFKIILFQIFILLSANVFATDQNSDLAAFPLAKQNMNRFVIDLPELDRDQELNSMVEVIVGKRILTDSVNKMRLGGVIESHILDGWGYYYYEVKDKLPVMTTLQAAKETSQTARQFVSMQPIKVAYNSRLPIVLYVPTGYEVRYRLWQTTAQTKNAKSR